MSLSPQLLEVLVCPRCKGALDYRQHEPSLVCRGSRPRTRSGTTFR